MGKSLKQLAAASSHSAVESRSDAELIHHHNNGDESAFPALVQRHAGLVLSLSRLNTSSTADADDACQEVFVLLASKATSITWKTSITNWLHDATRKVCRQLQRTRTRRLRREARTAPVAVPSPLDVLTARELLLLLGNAMSKLPAKYREPLLLCTVDGLSREEAATRMGVPTGTVKIRLERARQQLHQAFALRGLAVPVALLALSSLTPIRAALGEITQRILSAIDSSIPAATLAGGSILGSLSMKTKIALLGLGITLAGVFLSVGASPQPQPTSPKKPPVDQPVQTTLDTVDLAKLAPTKEPAYTAKPSYMLLAFDTQMKQRTWFVFEGEKLYIDRNGNGDLTDDGEPIAKGEEVTKGRFEYTVGDITTDGVKHTNVKITRFETGRPNDRPYASIELATARAGIKGNGPDGRVQYIAGGDISGLAMCSASVKDSSIVHFGQPYIIVSQQPAHAFVGEKQSGIRALVGSPGRGKGTFASVVYDGNIPAELHPVAEVTYSANKAGEKARTVKYDFSLRTCMIAHDVYFEPTEAGSAEVVFTFPAWKEGKVQPNTEHFTIQPKPKDEVAPMEKVSERFVATLPGVDNNHSMHRVRFNPEGTRLLYDSYPDGAVQFWDVTKRVELQRWQFAREPRSGLEFLNVAPDWKSFYYHENAEKSGLAKQDGKEIRTLTHTGQVKRYDFATGKVLDTIPKSDKRGVTASILSRCGKYLWVQEWHDAIVDATTWKSTHSLLNLTTGERIDLGKSGMMDKVFFLPDGKSFIALEYVDKTQQLQFRQLPDGAVVRKVELTKPEGKNTRGYELVALSADGKTLALNNGSHSLQTTTTTLFVDLVTLKPVGTWSFEVQDKEGFRIGMPGQFSSDGKQYIVTEMNNSIMIYDLATQMVTRTIPLPGVSWMGALSPDGKTYATLTNTGKPPVQRSRNAPEAALHPQFRVVLLDLQNPEAKPVELIGPRGSANHLAFSPDGKTLAVAATGGVHLFDTKVIEEKKR